MACISKRRGRYVIDFYDNQGKRRWRTLKKGTTKKRGMEILREIEEKLSRGTYVPEKRIPVFTDLAKEWVDPKKPNVRKSTLAVYEGITRNHYERLKDLKVNQITMAKVEKWIRQRQDEGLHIETLRKAIVVLNQIMAYAVRHGYIGNNPVRDAERPRGRGEVTEEKIRILTPDEIKMLLGAVTNQKYKTLFTLAIMSGARQGELLGLKWGDVDWENNQIHIQRTFNNGDWYRVKTVTSNRRIDLGPVVMGELKKWKLACPPNRLHLIFPNASGQPLNHSNMRSRYFFPALDKAAIGRVRFHDLRHTYASLLIEQGENIKYIQTQMGHATPVVTLTVYAHLLKPTNQEAAIQLEKAVF